MDLSTYASDIPRRKRLAAQVGVLDAYMYQLANGYGQPGPKLAKRIERATAELGPETVPRWSLRPDLWEPPAEAQADKQAL